MGIEDPYVLQILERIKTGTQSIETGATEISNRVKQYEEKIAELHTQIGQAELDKGIAEKSAAEANEKFQKAMQLQSGQYQQLILELFEIPKNNLENSIRNQSRRSNRITFLVAVLSILASIVVSLILMKDSSKTINNLISQQNQILSSMKEIDARSQITLSKFDNTVNSLRTIEGKTDFVIENMALNNPQITRVVELLHKEGAGFKSKNDFILAYRFRICPNVSGLKYEDYLKAFSIAKLPQEIVPTSPDELRQNDLQYIEL